LLGEETYQHNFVMWMTRWGKKYAADTFFHRYNNYRLNMDFVHNHKSKNSSFVLELNTFADLSHEEFKSMRTGLKYPSSPLGQRKEKMLFNPTEPSLDWRTKGAVTPVGDELSCGSSWAFSAVGALEGAGKIANGSLIPLSVQQLVDCSSAQGNSGCSGGFMDYAFEYVISNKGITAESNYKYVGKQNPTCKTKNVPPAVTCTGYLDVPQDEDQLMKAVNIGPVATAVEATSQVFQFYSGGILNDPSCGTVPGHGILLVGYGTLNGQDYWILKNNWGVKWGLKGYVLVARGQDMCGLDQIASYPTGTQMSPTE